MSKHWENLILGIQQTSVWEWLAVGLAIAYLLLILRENILGWYAAFFSTLIYTFLFWDVSLLMESALQVYYLLMALYGWMQWRNPGDKVSSVSIHSWSLSRHMSVLALIGLLTLISGYLLSNNTQASWPYLDSMTTWASVITTYMVAKKVLENWLYWVVIDLVSIFLYLERGLQLTAVLFIVYVIIAALGYFSWRRRFFLYKRELGNHALGTG